MTDLIIGALNKSIANKKYHLHSIDELVKILQKEELSVIDKYFLKELFTLPIPILKEKFLKSLDNETRNIFFKKAKELGFYNENIRKLSQTF